MNTQKLKDILKDPRTNWKYIAVVAVLAFITGAIIMNYLSKQGFEIPQIILPERKDETANWETYTNTKYGYSVKYPPTAVVAEHPPAGEERIQETTITFLFSPESGPSRLNIILAVIKNPDKKTPMQLAQEKYNQTEEMIINRSLEGDISKCKVEPVIRSKTNGARFTSCSTPAASGGILNFSEWYVKNGVTYEIYALLIDEDYLTTFNQILSTFTFLD